jgi:hypothetical protein
MAIANIFTRLDPMVQVAMVIATCIISVVAIIFGQHEIAFVAIIAFAPTPLGMILVAWNEVGKILNSNQGLGLTTAANTSSLCNIDTTSNLIRLQQSVDHLAKLYEERLSQQH